MRDLFKTIDALDITPDEVWTAVSYINDLGASSEAGLLAPGLGLEHFLDLRMDAEDKQRGVRTGTPRTIEGPLVRGGRSALEREGEPVALAGDYNVIPTDIDVYKPERWVDDALFLPEVRSAFATLLAMGWTDTVRKLHPGEHIYTFWDYFRNNFVRDAGLRIDHLLLSPSTGARLVALASIAKSADGKERATTGPPGSVRGWAQSSMMSKGYSDFVFSDASFSSFVVFARETPPSIFDSS